MHLTGHFISFLCFFFHRSATPSGYPFRSPECNEIIYQRARTWFRAQLTFASARSATIKSVYGRQWRAKHCGFLIVIISDARICTTQMQHAHLFLQKNKNKRKAHTGIDESLNHRLQSSRIIVYFCFFSVCSLLCSSRRECTFNFKLH